MSACYRLVKKFFAFCFMSLGSRGPFSFSLSYEFAVKALTKEISQTIPVLRVSISDCARRAASPGVLAVRRADSARTADSSPAIAALTAISVAILLCAAMC